MIPIAIMTDSIPGPFTARLAVSQMFLKRLAGVHDVIVDQLGGAFSIAGAASGQDCAMLSISKLMTVRNRQTSGSE
nr:hypothetical protein [Mesorhizobium sp. B1-1-8]